MKILLSEELWDFWRVGAPIPKEQVSIYARYAEKLEKENRELCGLLLCLVLWWGYRSRQRL